MDTSISAQLENTTHEVGHNGYMPNVWSFVKNRIDSLVDEAIQRTQLHLIYDSKVLETISRFKQHLKALLEEPLKNLVPGQHVGHTIHKDVEKSVDEAMQEVNISNSLVANESLSSVKKRLITYLDSEIELDVFNQVFTNGTYEVEIDPDLHHFHQPSTDTTMFLALISVAIFIPLIFIVLLMIFYKRQKDTKERRQEMLLEEQPEFYMEEYNNEDKQPEVNA